MFIPSDLIEHFTAMEADTFQKCRKLGIFYQYPAKTDNSSNSKCILQQNKRHIHSIESKLGLKADELPPPPPFSNDLHFNKVMDCIRAFEVTQMS